VVEAISSFFGSLRKEPAPDFPEGPDWINVARPLSLRALRGRLALLFFWNYG